MIFAVVYQRGVPIQVDESFIVKIPLNPPLLKGEELHSPLWQRGKIYVSLLYQRGARGDFMMSGGEHHRVHDR